MNQHRKQQGKVFDISKPNRVGPNTTSKPVIVGHRPMMTDPMVIRENQKEESTTPQEPTSQQEDKPAIFSGHKDLELAVSENKTISMPPQQDVPKPEPAPAPAPNLPTEKIEKNEPVPPPALPGGLEVENPQPIKPLRAAPPPPPPPATTHDSLTSILEENTPPPKPSVEAESGDEKPDNSHLVGSAPFPTPRGAGPRHWWGQPAVWLLIFIVASAGAYLAVDSGAIKTDLNLPFHFFKQS